VSAVRSELDGGVATLTLARPEQRNALSAELLDDLARALEDALDDPAVRVVILTNDGPAFCAGADLSGSDAVPDHPLDEILATILDAAKPIVGRIAGHCLGGGVGLAAACDISVAAASARFGFTEVRIGVAPAIISVVCLAKLRRADALELFLSGEQVPAVRAAEVGLVNRAVPDDDLDAAVGDLVAKLLAGAPGALAVAKALVRDIPAMPRDAAFARAAELSARLFGGDEAAAGMAAFRARRPAPWVSAVVPDASSWADEPG
jgi:methylglutaconyl-CoA hydratase